MVLLVNYRINKMNILKLILGFPRKKNGTEKKVHKEIIKLKDTARTHDDYIEKMTDDADKIAKEFKKTFIYRYATATGAKKRGLQI